MSVFKNNIILVPTSIYFHLITFAQFLFISFLFKGNWGESLIFSLSKKSHLKYNDIVLRANAVVFEVECNFDVTFEMSFHLQVLLLYAYNMTPLNISDVASAACNCVYVGSFWVPLKRQVKMDYLQF